MAVGLRCTGQPVRSVTVGYTLAHIRAARDSLVWHGLLLVFGVLESVLGQQIVSLCASV